MTDADGATPGSASLGDVLELVKLRLNSMVLATTLGGTWLASEGTASTELLVHAVGGTGLVAFGSAALNQVLERRVDALMHRTSDRPVAAGRIGVRAATAFGLAGSLGGLAWLAAGTTWLATVLAALTLVVYLFVYTPMKRRSASNTLVGAIPGAIPPLIGWAAAGEGLGAGAWVLFGILYLWQIPHFLAIAWLYRKDYARGGLVMLPGIDVEGSTTGRQAFLHTVGLILVSGMAVTTGIAGTFYLAGAVVLGLGFLVPAWQFARERTDLHARRLLRASLVYLPLLLVCMALDLPDFAAGR